MGGNVIKWDQRYPKHPMSQENQPNYTSFHEHSLDDRNRLSIPSEWRAGGSEEKFLAVQKTGPNGNFIQILPPAIAAQLKAKFDAVAFFDADAQAAKEDFYSTSQEVQLDKVGRVLLKGSLLKHAGIALDEKAAVMLRGGGSTFSIYSASQWAAAATIGGLDHRKTLSRLGI